MRRSRRVSSSPRRVRGGARRRLSAAPLGRRARAASAASGLSGSGELVIVRVGLARQGEPEAGALAQGAPGLQPAVVQPGVLERDGQAQAGAAGRAGPGRVGPPEAVEDERGLARPQPDAVVAHRDRDGGVVGAERTSIGRPSPCSIALTTRLRRMRSMRRESISAMTGSSGSSTTSWVPLRAASVRCASTARSTRGAQVGRLDVEHGGAGVEARDLEQVGQQRLEAVELVVQQLGRPRDRRARSPPRESWMRSPAIRIVVSGVRSSWETSETNRCCTRERFSSWAICCWMEAAISLKDVAEAGEVVLALGLHALVEVAVGEPLRDDRRPPHRVGDEAGHDEGDRPEQQDERRAAEAGRSAR